VAKELADVFLRLRSERALSNFRFSGTYGTRFWESVNRIIGEKTEEIAREYPLVWLDRREEGSRKKSTLQEKIDRARGFYNGINEGRALEYRINTYHYSKAADRKNYWQGELARFGVEVPKAAKLSEIFANLAAEYARWGK